MLGGFALTLMLWLLTAMGTMSEDRFVRFSAVSARFERQPGLSFDPWRRACQAVSSNLSAAAAYLTVTGRIRGAAHQSTCFKSLNLLA